MLNELVTKNKTLNINYVENDNFVIDNKIIFCKM
jgi:hypothetical protein